MTTLVTGGAGYIGSHMVLALVDRGERVVVLDDLSTGTRSLVPASVPFVQGSVGDLDLVLSLIRRESVEAIIHFAGSIVVPDSVTDPLGYYKNNTSNSRTLLEAAVRGGVAHFIFSSTAAVYGNPDASPIGETAALRPVSPYGTSKLMTELMMIDAGAAHGLRHVALRYFNVAGADPDGRSGQCSPRATHLIKIAAEAAVGKRAYLEIYGQDYPTPDGTCVRDYIHVSDLAAAHVAALAYLRGGGTSDVFNCGYGRGFSVRDVVEAVKRVSGVEFEVRLAARRAGDPASLVADNRKLRERLNWLPALDDLDTIVGHALSWEKTT